MCVWTRMNILPILVSTAAPAVAFCLLFCPFFFFPNLPQAHSTLIRIELACFFWLLYSILLCVFLVNQPLIITNKDMGFFGGSVIETELPMQGTQVLSLIRELWSYTLERTHTQSLFIYYVQRFQWFKVSGSGIISKHKGKCMCVCVCVCVCVYIYIYIFFFFSIWPCHAACGILVQGASLTPCFGNAAS